jgi:hypothetical protein
MAPDLLQKFAMEPSTGTQDETVCPQCGGIATWGYSNAEKTQVLVTCADCGSLGMTRAEFDRSESEMADTADEV